MLSMVFSSSVFAAEKEQSAWDSFLGLFSAKTAATSDVGVEYRGHIQNVGNYPLDGSWIQGPTELGTEGKGLRLEGFWIQLDGDVPADAHIEYQVHVQNVGWMDPVQDGEFAGTEGRSLQIEAIKISLVDDEGVQLEDYSVVYSGHVQNVGDVGPFTNGEQLGTVGSFLRLEAIEVEIVQNPADLTEYNAALAAVTQADYTAASWTTYQAVVNANKMTEDNLQSEVDAATANITAAQKNLVLVPKVTSVTAINGVTLTVTYNKPVNAATALSAANYKIAGTAINPANLLAVDGITLSADKTAVTFHYKAANKLVANTPQYFEVSNVTDLQDNKIVNYKQIFEFVDKTAATITGVTYPSNVEAIVAFSEPMAVINTANVEVLDSNNQVTAATATTSTLGDAKLSINTTALEMNKTYTVKIYNATDLYSNFGGTLTTTITKTTEDKTAPTLDAVVSSGLNKVVLTFNEPVLTTAGTVKIDTAAAANISTLSPSLSTDKKTMTVTLGAPVTAGLHTVTVNGVSDVSSNVMTVAKANLVNFVNDTTAPKVKSSTVTNGKLYVTFDKNITVQAVADMLTGITYVSNSVEYTVAETNNVFTAYNPSAALEYDTIVLDLTGFNTGAYSATLVAGTVKDVSANTNASAATKITFDYASTDSTKPAVVDSNSNPADGASGITQSGNTINVVFDRTLDATSALTLSNYTVDGESR